MEGPEQADALSADHYPPDFTRRNCGTFLEDLGAYFRLLQRFCHARQERLALDLDAVEGVMPAVVVPQRAARLWQRLERLGLELLAAGNAWQMSQWLRLHLDWLPIERSGFFEDQDVSKRAVGEQASIAEALDDGCWGHDLSDFLAWRKKTGQPLGFSGRDVENDPCMLEFVFDDVGRDIRALLAAANERALGEAFVPPPLSSLEKAVLQLIPRGGETGLTGRQLIAALKRQCWQLDQSTLTTHVIPKLKRFYGVGGRPGVGYYRP
jgi:hypothetical protein